MQIKSVELIRLSSFSECATVKQELNHSGAENQKDDEISISSFEKKLKKI